jgi:hypothetical protein
VKPLEQFQDQHPEILVVTAMDVTADSKDLKALMHEQKLKSLRIAPIPAGLMTTW